MRPEYRSSHLKSQSLDTKGVDFKILTPGSYSQKRSKLLIFHEIPKVYHKIANHPVHCILSCQVQPEGHLQKFVFIYHCFKDISMFLCSIEFAWVLWFIRVFYVSLWFVQICKGSLCFDIYLYDSLWFIMICYGPLWLVMVCQGSLGFYSLLLCVL